MASENADRYCIAITPDGTKQDVNGKAAIFNEFRWNAGDQIRVKFMEGDESPPRASQGGCGGLDGR